MNDTTNAHTHVEHFFPKGYDPSEEPWKSISAFVRKLTTALDKAAETMALEADCEIEALRKQLEVAICELSHKTDLCDRAHIPTLEQQKEEIAVLKSQIENNDVMLEQVRMIERSKLKLALEQQGKEKEFNCPSLATYDGKPPAHEAREGEILRKILDASFDGCEASCLHCGEVNDLASAALFQLNTVKGKEINEQ